MKIIALDIGGANIKVCWLHYCQGRVVNVRGKSVYFELWKDPRALLGILQELKREEAFQAVALTMTAELCDVFATSEEGVHCILGLIEECFGGLAVYVWHTGGGFYELKETRKLAREVAAANWLASIEYLAQQPLLKEKSALVLDIGSTTTDLLAVANGKTAVIGRTDLQRLQSGELVYTGVLRTFIPAITNQIYVNGQSCPISSEYFAIMADVYRVLGDISEESYNVATPDGKDKSKLSCMRRLARIVDSDVETLGQAGILQIARYLKEKQVQLVMQGIWQIYSRQNLPYPSCLISASQGDFLTKEIAQRMGIKVFPWWEVEGYREQNRPDCALTVYALAYLLAIKLAKETTGPFASQNSLDIIAVLDLKDGKVVHAVAGERQKYRPVQSVLCASAEIREVVQGIVKLGVDTFYIADLDAIAGQKDNLEAVSTLITSCREQEEVLGKLEFYLDAGIGDYQGVERIFRYGIDKVIVGTETLSSLSALRDILGYYGSEQTIISLDMRFGKVITRIQDLDHRTPLEVVELLLDIGVRNLLFIELDRVGTGSGLNRELILSALSLMEKNTLDRCSLYIGGGVGQIDELLTLKAWGVSGVMVATMLHRGILNYEHIDYLRS